jgi:hypothetical protein
MYQPAPASTLRPDPTAYSSDGSGTDELGPPVYDPPVYESDDEDDDVLPPCRRPWPFMARASDAMRVSAPNTTTTLKMDFIRVSSPEIENLVS